MTTIHMKSWKKGLQSVSLIEVVCAYSTGSLSQAKTAVERLLAGEAITLQFESDATKEAFRRRAELLGVECE